MQSNSLVGVVNIYVLQNLRAVGGVWVHAGENLEHSSVF